ncbi:MAG TPA: efflux transporter outer membrane subunit [Steroidobacter sp.]|jgi:multidrug efflux system outer membrane protein|nr:efflux transporter outer membrane subunit [Steroidobacteraceae bacterium]HLS80283.1 efflux transporter outer membrane subunit [Steroidobacter sp.]
MALKRHVIARLPTKLEATPRCALTVIALLMVGCGSMAPRYQPSSAPIPNDYPADAPRTSGQLGGTLEWRSVIADAELQRLIERALGNSRDLRVALLRVQEARALRGIQRADRFPNIAVNAAGDRGRTPADLSVLGRSTVSSAYQVTAGVATWELDFWGRVRNLDLAAIENYLAADAARRAFVVSLVAQVADAWLFQRELDRRLAIANSTLRSREESFRIFKRRFEVGASTQLELMQVETLLTQAQSLAVQLEQARATNRHAIDLLAGEPIDLPLRTDTFDRDAEPVRAVSAGLPSDLLVQRPDVIAAEHQLRAAHANIGAARAAFFPRVTLTGNFGVASAQLDGLFESGSRAWTFTPFISLPIFTGGRLRSNLDLAEVRRDLAVANYELTIQTAFRDVADALSVHHWLGEQLRIQRNALRALTERSRLAQLRYDSGAASYLEVLDAQRDLLSAEQALVQLQSALQSSRVALFAALGGGTLGAGE